MKNIVGYLRKVYFYAMCLKFAFTNIVIMKVSYGLVLPL